MATKKELEENKKLKQKAERLGSRRAKQKGKVNPKEFSKKIKKIKKKLNLKKGGMVNSKSTAKKYFKGGMV